MSAMSPLAMYSPRRPTMTPRSARSRTISSAKNGLPAARPAMRRRQPVDRRVAAEQFGDQRCGLRIIKRCKRNRLRTGQPREFPAIFGPVGGDHQRRGLGDDRDEVSEHRVADVVDPVRVLDDVDGGCGAGQRGRVDQAGEASSSRVRVDRRVPVSPGLGCRADRRAAAGRRRRRCRVCARTRVARRLGVGAVDAEYRAQQTGDGVKGDVARVGFAVGGEHLDPRERRCRTVQR